MPLTPAHDGKWVLFHRVTAERFERWPVDARDMLATGDYTTDIPTGETGDSPAVTSEAPVPEQPDPSTIVPGLATVGKEHSPGVPLVLVTSADAAPAAPIVLPIARNAAAPRRGRR